MTTDSLIDKLRSASTIVDRHTDYPKMMIPLDKAISIVAMGDASTRKDEERIAKAASAESPVISSEIRLHKCTCSEGRMFHEAKCHFALRGSERVTEPVSGLLEKCIESIDIEGMNEEQIAKAVLDAAGVAYVD